MFKCPQWYHKYIMCVCVHLYVYSFFESRLKYYLYIAISDMPLRSLLIVHSSTLSIFIP